MIYKLKLLQILFLVIISGNAISQISVHIKNTDGSQKEISLESISAISPTSINKKALKAIGYPDITEKEFIGYSGLVQYDFTFTSTNIIDTKLTYGFSTNRYQALDNAHRPQKMDNLLLKEHQRVFEKVKKYLRLKEGTIYVMRIPIRFEWDEKNDKSIERGVYLIDKKYQLKGIHDKNAKC